MSYQCNDIEFEEELKKDIRKKSKGAQVSFREKGEHNSWYFLGLETNTFKHID